VMATVRMTATGMVMTTATATAMCDGNCEGNGKIK
jgi:hypothetical protein